MPTVYAGFDVGDFPGGGNQTRGLQIMRELFEHTCLYWCGYYLNFHPSWTGTYASLRTIGWGVAPIYLGSSTHLEARDGSHKPNSVFQQLRHGNGKPGIWLTRDFLKSIGRENTFKQAHERDLKQNLFGLGFWDGMQAGWLANANGIKPPTVIYFDMESQPEVDENVSDVVKPKKFFYFPEWMDYYRGWCRGIHEQGYTHGLYTNPALGNLAITQWGQASEFGVLRYPHIWVAAAPWGLGGDFTVTQDGIFKGHRTSSGSALQMNPLSVDKSGHLGASTWQFAGNLNFDYRDDQSHWQAQWADLDSSLFRDPGQPGNEALWPRL
jgi:hypothetical protein